MSRPPRDIHQAIGPAIRSVCHCCLQAVPGDFAVATVLKAAGSTPCKAGAKAIIDSGGAILGTIGGGAVEARAQQLAVEAIKIGRPMVFDFNLEGDAVEGSDPICGGMMRVLIDPTAARRSAAYAAASRPDNAGERGVLLTMVRGEKDPEVENAPDIDVLFLAEAEIPAEYRLSRRRCPSLRSDARGNRPVCSQNRPRKGNASKSWSSRSFPTRSW